MRIFYFIFLSFFWFSVYAENIKIGYIDTQKVIDNITQYEKNLKILSIEFEPKKKELLDLFNHINLLRDKIDSNTKNLDFKTLEIEKNKLYSLEESFKNETELWQTTLNNRKIELLQQLENQINKAIVDFAKKENYDLIFYENVAYASDKANITEQIIKKIEKQDL